MKAIRIHQYGDASVLQYEEAENPQPQDDDVLIRVAATSFNPLDAKIRAGLMKEMIPKVLPFVIGGDCAGTVESVGANVHDFQVGDEVYAKTDSSRGGTYAEYVAVEASHVALAPKSLSLNEAAALPMVAQTAVPEASARWRFKSPKRAAPESLRPLRAAIWNSSNLWARTKLWITKPRPSRTL